MTGTTHAHPRTAALAFAGIALVCGLLLLFARYAVAPVTDFSSDDWGFLNRAVHCGTYAEAWKLTLKDPDRPLQAGVITVLFKWLGDHPPAYALLGIVTNLLVLVLALALVGSLTRSRRTMLCFGVLMALWPNLIESYNWAAMTTVGYNQAAYVGCALGWVLYLRRGQLRWLILSVLCYGVAVTTYEWGFGLPTALALLLLPSPYRRKWRGLFAFALVIAPYLAWRFTRGFGTAPGVLFVPREPDMSLSLMLWNARDVIGWWVGGHMLTCLRNGLDAYAAMSLHAQRFFYVADLGIAALLAVLLLRSPKDEDPGERSAPTPHPFPPTLVATFGVAWAVVGHAPSLVSWVAARMIFFPAVGITLFCSALLNQFDVRRWLPWLSIAAFVFLMADQGTNFSWKEAGELQRRLYLHVGQHVQNWSTADVLLFDTSAIRHRQTSGLLAPSETSPQSWAYTGNACLLRGFVPWSMIRLASPDGPWPETALDMECDAHREGNELIWHETWDPSKPRRTPMEKVYTVDCLGAGSGQER